MQELICELRRNHPRWGARRVLFELSRVGCPGPIPSRITVHRILVRHGLIDERPRRRRREDYLRWERDRPMELWQMDIVGGVMLADGREAKVVTEVVEREPAWDEAGTGIYLPGNAARALRVLGLEHTIMGLGGGAFYMTAESPRARPGMASIALILPCGGQVKEPALAILMACLARNRGGTARVGLLSRSSALPLAHPA